MDTTSKFSLDASFDVKILSDDDFEEFPEIINCVMASRQQLFPMLDHRQLPEDLLYFDDTFISTKSGCFIRIRSQKALVAVAGFKAYDFRFQHLNIQPNATVELVKLYVNPRYRRMGIAQYLVNELKTIARQRKINNLYLHTHPFLPGAQAFWLRQRFKLIHQDTDPIWRTLHMLYPLNAT
ncbi:GNAT family N-acetyltransferase [Acinetobacter puyangensis]|uniref:GNAT family N-acetyltransferase n=1 Tax=Acinetobacter puyangensis TaxID=1096779 RepID=UPI003A4DB67B